MPSRRKATNTNFITNIMVWPNRGSNQRSTTLEASTLTITPALRLKWFRYSIIWQWCFLFYRCGLAGETGPRCIVPSQVRNEKTGKVHESCIFFILQRTFDIYILIILYFHWLTSVNFSHFNLLLWNPSAKWTEAW